MLAIPWVVFAVVWVIGAFRVKRVVRKEDVLTGLGHNIFLILGALLLMGFPHAVSERVFPKSLEGFFLGLVLTTLGIAFTIWARVVIASNWSANVTIKEGHELVTSGPYRLVRHPIYTGLLLALAGTAIAFGTLGALLSLPLFLVGFWLKLRIEERFMRHQFGAAYDAYAARTKALIPFLL